MKNLDILKQQKADIINSLSESIKNNDIDAMEKSMTEWQNFVTEQIMSEAQGIVNATDRNILSTRGIRQLTSEETKFYESFIANARQEGVITGITNALPETVIDSVLDDIRHTHPLLDVLNFQNTSTVIKTVLNKQGSQQATWNELNTDIAKKLAGEIELVDMILCKLSAYMYVTKDMLELGPTWVDRYTREVLSEALACGLEPAIVDGDGVKKPIGMTRDFTGDFNSTTGYARKTPIEVTSFDVSSYGELLSKLAVDRNGNSRTISEVILVVNPSDYFTKIMPATTLLVPQGGYVNNVLPFPTKVIQSTGVPKGYAVIGIAKNYFMGIGTAKGGKLEYDDSYKFLEDLRTYTVRLYGNGRPTDINSFLYLDIRNLRYILPTYEIISGSTATE